MMGSIPLQHNGEGELQLNGTAAAAAIVDGAAEVAERLRK